MLYRSPSFRKRACFLLTLVFISSLGIVRGQTDYAAVMTNGGLSLPFPTTVSASDNGQYLRTSSTGVVTIHRVDPNGQVAWSQNIALQSLGLYGMGMAADDAGGVFLACYTDLITHHTQWSFMDTSIFDMHFIRLDANGAVLWERHYERTCIHASSDLAYIGRIDLLSNANGGFTAACHYTGASWPQLDLLSFDENGALIWGRNVGELSAWENVAVNPFALNIDRSRAAATPSNGVVIEFPNEGPTGPHRIMAIDSSGDVAWVREIIYSNSPYLFEVQHITADDVGRPVACALVGTSTGVFCMLLTFASNGQSVIGEMVRIPFLGNSTTLFVQPDGDRTVILNPYNNGPQWILHLDSLGTPASCLRTRSETIGNEMVSAQWTGVDLRDDHIVFTGMEKRQDTLFGSIAQRNCFARLPVDSLIGCFWSDTTVSRYAMPPGAITSTIPPDHVSLPMESTLAIVPGVNAVFTPAVIPTQEDLCIFAASTNDLERSTGPLHIQPTLLQHGEDLLVSDATKGTLSVRDASGRLITSVRTNAGSSTLRLSTSGWAPGLHLLQVMGTDGTVRSARLMVQ